MARKEKWPPVPTSHRGYDRIRVTVAGRKHEFSLGPTGSEEARTRYLRKVAELEANQGRPSLPGLAVLTVAELAARYLVEAESNYCKSQFVRIKRAMAPVTELYLQELAVEFGPVALATVRHTFVKAGYCRRLTNQMTGCIRRAWRWASSLELIPHSCSAALSDLDDLKSGRTIAKDFPPIEPVDPDAIDAVIPFLLPEVAAIVRFQQYTGCRPGEACLVRPADIIRPWLSVGDTQVWLFDLGRSHEHKNAWRGQHRKIVIGPKAQAVLAPFLSRDPELYCFRPCEAMDAFLARRRLARKSKVQPSQVDRSCKSSKKMPGERYTTMSYGHAVRKACIAAGVKPWTPLQIRHLAGTDVETLYDQDAARCLLGHATPSSTAVYAAGLKKAAKVVAAIG